ncbi:MAG: TlpA family protein disulfide reductase [Bacteroidetes bacterium]|nr:TlpA family protein disulfide reductase [Bacteroidota bacterium]
MKIFYTIILTYICISISFGKQPFAEVQLKEGLPKLGSKVGGYEAPIHGEIKSNGLFHSIYFVKDLAKEETKYYLLISSNPKSINTIIGSMKKMEQEFYDSLTITLQNENEQMVAIELYYNKSIKELKYRWCNSKESNDENPGGFPQLINPKVMIGSIAPNFNVTMQNGDKISLTSLKGTYVYIDFWGTWCGGCIMEIPNIQKLRDSYNSKDLFIIGLAAYDNEEKLSKFLVKTPLNYPTALIDENIVNEYGVKIFPSSYLIDKNGKVIGKNMRGEDLVEQVKTRINNTK